MRSNKIANAVEYIDGIVKFTEKNSMEHTRTLLDMLGSPDMKFKSVHVAGTNGKGSTCAFIESALRKGGYKTGLFTSPHLIDIKERFIVSGEVVSDEVFLEAFDEVKAASDELVSLGGNHPTWFEFLYLCGMKIFELTGVEIAVIETGLGGRLDATCATGDVILTVITKIGRDHMKYLGDTIEEIAFEKAGIIKPGVPCVHFEEPVSASCVIEKVAKEKDAKTYCPKGECEIVSMNECGIDFFPAIEYHGNTAFHMPFPAPYQTENATLALLALRVLSYAFPVSDEDIRSAFSSVVWRGRMQKIGEDIYVDGAHNPEGVRAFCHAALNLDKKSHTVLFGAMADKEWQDMADIICEELKPELVITVSPDEWRGVSSKEAAGYFESKGVASVAFDETKQAFDYAVKKKGNGRLLVAGSLYLIGRILHYDKF